MAFPLLVERVLNARQNWESGAESDRRIAAMVVHAITAYKVRSPKQNHGKIHIYCCLFIVVNHISLWSFLHIAL